MEKHSSIFYAIPSLPSSDWESQHYHDSLRLSERFLYFDLPELCYLVAKSTKRETCDISRLVKIAESHSYRMLEVTFLDGLKVIVRLPYPCTTPRKYGVASEVATMEFLRDYDVPIPKILAWSSSNNLVGSEFILMEGVSGKLLSETWYVMTDEEKRGIIKKVVDIESTLFKIRLPAHGSLYLQGYLDRGVRTVDIPNDHGSNNPARFCIGPSTEQPWWHQKRDELPVNRGPWRTAEEVLKSAGDREKLWLQRFGKMRYPKGALYREPYDGERVDPRVQIEHLSDYMKLAPYLVPKEEELNMPTIRHPGLSPSNIFVSESGEITGIIDWQHTTILPKFLQAKPSKCLQNDTSEKFRRLDFAKDALYVGSTETQKEAERCQQREGFHLDPTNIDELDSAHFSTTEKRSLCLPKQIYDIASRPWEGDITSLQAHLIKALAEWSAIASPEDEPPIRYSEEEIKECLDGHAKQKRAGKRAQLVRDFIGCDVDGLVRTEDYQNALRRARMAKKILMEGSTGNERKKQFRKLWPYRTINRS
ncbi:Protein kinase-like (PK-like) [Glarea lozoyensis ATCC 20868]|uniref:Protein kinase-like (PK-like) n=1 Tax=Glarea lozoyensis (strain ATCC 20868 / MF5171) TaxID=1116229 RepID=S3DEG8_GLAL2|nr:Protein kinase-like (PK-like) [Glarea lozoyensis ATCC 20868]EPE25063.1 Protein kinase-like (PK-like) [Glarea lozoyensis ATCC 20868]